MGCTVSRDGGAGALADEAAWHHAGTPQAEEKKAAAQRAGRRRLTTGNEEPALPRQLFQSGAGGVPCETSLDKKLAELNMDHVVKFHVDARSTGSAQPQPQPQRRPAAQTAVPAGRAAAPTAPQTGAMPAANLLKTAAARLPPVIENKPIKTLPASVVGIAERLSNRGGQVGPVQPNGTSARPRVAQQPSSLASTDKVKPNKVVPGIIPRGPIETRAGLGRHVTESAACLFPPHSADDEVSTASQRSAAAMRASVDVLLRGPRGEIPVGHARCNIGSDKPKRRPVVRRKAGSGPIARTTSGSSVASDSRSVARTHSAGSNAGSAEGAYVNGSSLPAILCSETTSGGCAAQSTVSGQPRSVDADKENVGAGNHSQPLQEKKSRRKYPTADVRAFVKAARLPSTIVPRLLELLSSKDLANLPVRSLEQPSCTVLMHLLTSNSGFSHTDCICLLCTDSVSTAVSACVCEA